MRRMWFLEHGTFDERGLGLRDWVRWGYWTGWVTDGGSLLGL